MKTEHQALGKATKHIQAALDRFAQALADLQDGSAGQDEILLAELENLRKGVDELLHSSASPQDELPGFPPSSRLKDLPQEEMPNLNRVLDDLCDGFFTLNKTWKITFINKRAAENVGTPAHELVGKRWCDVFPWMSSAEHDPIYHSVMEQRAPARFEMRGPEGLGWFEIKVHPVRDGIAVYWLDVTARKLAELERERLVKELEEARQVTSRMAEEAHQAAQMNERAAAEMETILNNLMDAVLVFDYGGIVRRANPYTVVMLGFDPLGMHWRDILQRIQVTDDHGAPVPGVERLLRRGEHGELMLNQMVQITSPRGRLSHVLASILPLNLGIEFTGFVLVLKDITQHEALQAEYRRQRDLLEQVVHESPVGIAVLDEPGHRYSMVNPYYHARTTQKRDLIGQTIEQGWPDMGRLLQEPLDEVLRTGKPFSAVDGLFMINGKKGLQENYYTFSLIPLFDHAGEVSRIVVLLLETTEEVQARMQLEQELEERKHVEQALRLAAEAGEIGIWEHDRRTGQLTWDERTLSIFGLPPDVSITYDMYLSLVNPNDRALVQDAPFSRGEKMVTYEIEYQITTPNGEQRWIYERGRCDMDEDGQPVTFTGVVMDFTRFKQAEADRSGLIRQLAAEHARLETVLQALPVAVWITDETGRMVRKNSRADELYEGDAPMPQTIEDYSTFKGWWADSGREVAPKEWPVARAILEGIRTLNKEIEIRLNDGARATMMVSAAPMYDADGHLVGAVSVRQDITERRKVEAALRESEARFRLALENSPIAMCTCDKDLRYTWLYNPIAGLDTQSMLGKRDDELLPVDSAAELLALKQSAMQSETGLSGEIQITNNGRTYSYIMNIEPLRAEDGQVVGIIGAALDISEQRQLEAQHLEYTMQVEVQRRLLEHREMERQMIARELHDGPIQNLIGLLFLVQSVLDLDPAGEVGEALRGVRDGAQTLVSELRMVCNELRPPSLVQFGLARAIRSHAEDFQTRNPLLDVHLDLMEDGRSLPDAVRLALYRIYQEALNNIVRHSQATQVTVRLGLDAQGVRLELADNGRGFVFPQEWVDLARHGHLGLVGMKERAEAIGGKFDVNSQPGEGTTLSVMVPRGF